MSHDLPDEAPVFAVLREDILPDLLAATMALRSARLLAARRDAVMLSDACASVIVRLEAASGQIRALLAHDQSIRGFGPTTEDGQRVSVLPPRKRISDFPGWHVARPCKRVRPRRPVRPRGGPWQ